MHEVPPLWTDLRPLVDPGPDSIARIEGVRHWWAGPLDVEGLALGATQAAATALGSLTGRTISLTSERVAASFGSLNHLRIDGRRPEGLRPSAHLTNGAPARWAPLPPRVPGSGSRRPTPPGGPAGSRLRTGATHHFVAFGCSTSPA